MTGGEVNWGQEEAKGEKKKGRRGPVLEFDEENIHGGGATMASWLTEERARGRVSAGFPMAGRSPRGREGSERARLGWRTLGASSAPAGVRRVL